MAKNLDVFSSHDKKLAVFSILALAALIWFLMRKKTNTLVTTSITFDGKEVERVDYATLLTKMYPNEFIDERGKLCYSYLGKVTCFSESPSDVLLMRA
jgi:hypothetical protein